MDICIFLEKVFITFFRASQKISNPQRLESLHHAGGSLQAEAGTALLCFPSTGPGTEETPRVLNTDIFRND